MPSGFTGPPLNLPMFADNEHNWGAAMDQSLQDINDAIGALQTGGGAVSSVAGKTGAVTLVESDIANLVSDLAAITSSIPTLLSQISGILALNAGGTGADLSGISDGLLPFKSGSILSTSSMLSWDDINKTLNISGTGTSSTNGIFITGTTSGSSVLEVHNSFAAGANFYTHSNTDFRGPTIALYRSGGTQASPTNLLAGYALGYLSFLGYDGTAYATGVSLEAQMGSAWNTGNHNCSMTVSANLANSSTLTPVFVFNSTSNNGGDVDGNISRINLYVQNTKVISFLSGDVTPVSGLSHITTSTIGVGNGTQGDISGTLKANTFDAGTGFRIAGTASSGKVLRGNGTNFISSNITFPDISTITTEAAATVDSATALVLTPVAPASANAIFETHNTFSSGIDLFTQAIVGNLGRAATIHFYKSHGATLAASPLGVANGDALGVLAFGGHNGTAYNSTGARIEADATETWSTIAQGTRLLFATNVNGSVNLTGCFIALAGTTSSFPAIKRNATAVNFRLADDSADCPITASIIGASTGFQISGAAASGNVLRGNGTNFISSQLAYADLSGAPQLPVTKAAVASNFLTSYTSGTGLFTAAQPAFSDISGTASAAQYVTMVGDSGAGGTKGAVPAPASGDAAAARFLKADGTWAVPAGSGSGTVTSVAMTGDGVIFNTTVTGSPVTVSGTLVPSLLTQTANFVLAGPTSGGAAAPTFRALVASDIPASLTAWSALTNASGALTLSNAGNTTTFNQTSAVTWTWANTTAATSGTSQSSPLLSLNGTYWTGAASATESWSIQTVIANGTNGASTLAFVHSGTTGNRLLQVPSGSFVGSAVNNGSISFASGNVAIHDGNAAVTISSGAVSLNSHQLLKFGATSDAGISRTAASTFAFGNGVQADVTGILGFTTANLTGKVATYNNIATVANGIPAIYNQANLTAQAANVAATTLYAVPAGGAGLYRISVFIIVSQAATTSSTMPDTRIIYTDQDSGATITIAATASSGGNTTSTFAQATFVVNAKLSTNIQYSIGQANAYASTGGTPMQFAYRARAEYLG